MADSEIPTDHLRESLEESRYTRRQILKLGTAATAAVAYESYSGPFATLFQEPSSDEGTPTPSIYEIPHGTDPETSLQRFYSIEDKYITAFTDGAEVYGPNANLKVIHALDDNQNSMFSMAVPIGREHAIGQGDEIVHSSWFSETDEQGNKEFLLNDWIHQVLVPIWDMYDKTIEDGVLKPEDTQEILAHTGSQPSAFDRTQKIACIPPNKEKYTTWLRVHNTVNANTFHHTPEQEYKQQTELMAMLHEWFHAFEYTQVPPDIFGSEAFATAYMLNSAQELGILSSEQDQLYRKRLAELFFENQSLEMKPLIHETSEAGYEHAAMIEWLMKINDQEWPEIVDRLKNLPCDILPPGPSRPIPEIFDNQLGPETYASYLAQVLAPRGTQHNEIFSQSRELLADNYQELSHGEIVELAPHGFFYYYINVTNYPVGTQHKLHIEEDVVAATLDSDHTPYTLRDGSIISIDLRPNIGFIPVVIANISDQPRSSHISLRSEEDDHHLYTPHLLND